jgi:ribonuclease P protein component
LNSLLKENIISGRKEISRIFKTGITWRSSLFKILYERNSLSNDRFAVLVSKQNGNAVERNRIKRKYREIFRTNKRSNPPFFDFLIIPGPGISPEPREIKSAFLLWVLQLEKESCRL